MPICLKTEELKILSQSDVKIEGIPVCEAARELLEARKKLCELVGLGERQQRKKNALESLK